MILVISYMRTYVRIFVKFGSRHAKIFFGKNVHRDLEKSTIADIIGAKKEGRLMFIEQKALLRSLEEMSGIIESMDRRFMLKALGSFSCRLPAEAQAERLIELTERKKRLLLLRLNVCEALRNIKPEYRRILAEKYGFDEEKKGVTDEKNRNYYRKLALAVGKFASALETEGIDAEKIREEAACFHFLAEAISIEKNHSVGASNFGVLRNTFGYDLKSLAKGKA